jgi:FSR family fosmidomycin resistance protein-like MFS transporter
MLLLFASRSMGLDIAAVGFVGTVYGIFSSLTQPLFGYLGDLKGGRIFVAGGVLVMTVFQMLMGIATEYWMLLVCAAFAGMGSAAFHPQGASGATRAAGDRKTAGMSVFMFGGNFGYGTGPGMAGLIGDVLGRAALPIMSLIGLVLAPVLWVLLAPQGKPAAGASGRTMLRFNKAYTVFGIASLMIVMMMRSWSSSAITFFTPPFFTTLAGYTPALAGQLSTVQLWLLACGTLLGGLLADRIGGRKVMFASFILMAPLSWAYWNTVGPLNFLVAGVLGFITGASWPPLIVMAQELFPKSAGLASGLALGFAFAMGYVGQGISSFLAAPGRLGLYGSMMLVPLLPLVAVLFAQFLPKREAILAAAQREAALSPKSA